MMIYGDATATCSAAMACDYPELFGNAHIDCTEEEVLLLLLLH